MNKPTPPVDAEYVIACLEDAGRTLYALPFPKNAAPPRSAKSGHPDVLREVMEAYGWDRDLQVKPAVPSRFEISRMDEVYEWLRFVANPTRKRLVFARSIVNPVQERHLYSWRRLGNALGCDHKAAQRWHGYGIEDIVRGLTQDTVVEGACPTRPIVLGSLADDAA